MGRLRVHIRDRLVGGILLLIPLAITYAVLRFLWDTLQGLFDPVLEQVPGPVSGITLSLMAAVILGVLLYLTGLLGTTLLGGRLLRVWESLMDQIPIVRPIYRITRDTTRLLAGGSRLQTSRVVFLEYPRSGVISLGLVTGRYVSPDGEAFITVYIPTIPNPTSGFLAIVKKEQVTETDLTFEDAMKIVISAGVLTDEVVQSHRVH